MGALQEVKKSGLAKKELVDSVALKVREFVKKGELILPVNYISENAMKSAWLMLQEVQDRDKNLALDVCTKESVANALLSMVCMGLNPDKKQCYFIVYGKKLQLQRSYFGSMAVAKMVNPNIEDIYGMAIYEGDELDYEIKRGKRFITRHVQKFENIKKENVVGAYAVVLFSDGTEKYEVMTIDEIHQAWRQSKNNPFDEKGALKSFGTHGKFTADMAIKTVINKACKPIINSSSDSSLVARFARESDDEAHEAEVNETIELNANQEALDFDDNEVVEVVEEFKEPSKQEKVQKPVQEEIVVESDDPY